MNLALIRSINRAFCHSLMNAFVETMFTNWFFQASSEATSNGYDRWGLPRPHQTFYMKIVDKINQLLNPREFDPNKAGDHRP